MKYISIKTAIIALLSLAVSSTAQAQRVKYNFNSGWHWVTGKKNDVKTFFQTPLSQKSGAHDCTLPHAWNEDEAFAKTLPEMAGGVVWYYKTFRLPQSDKGKKVFIEFEGARQAADVWVNGKSVGFHENGVMAFGFDITPYIYYDRANEICVRTDADWWYHERPQDGIAGGTKFQWNDRNFNFMAAGLRANVNLHVTGKVHQTLPLYSNLKTTGVYVYGSDYDIKGRKVTCNIESQVINSTDAAAKVQLTAEVTDRQTGKTVARFKGSAATIAAGDTAVLKAKELLSGIHFWSWGYGYLYDVRTSLTVNGKTADEVTTRTGFRKTRFGEGKIWLNDRVMMVHGYAQRTTNEWPALGVNIPAWMSDYSNDLFVKSGGNVVRWMHVCPSKQDVESCDRVGLIQAMPAGDAEKDREGRSWEMRKELMRDAIIYNRNNPSIMFYESGNSRVTEQHMAEMKAIRDMYDPNGGRAAGCREMLNVDIAEYGGEMLYINKSKKHPMWAMEYCRDEANRLYWDEFSYPYHTQGAGPYYRKAYAGKYNQNNDQFAIEQIRRWDEYFQVRPGFGKRSSSGGVKIIFSDSNTHGRSEVPQRVSGVVDAMRIPKDAFYCMQVMWDSWVDIEHKKTYIIGHWNYPEGVRKNVYVCSTSPVVALLQDGKEIARCDSSEYDFLYTFKNVAWQPGTLKAVGYAADGTTVESEYEIKTAGAADHIRLTLMKDPNGMKADGADVAIVQVEVVDKDGIRCPVDNRTMHYTVEGQGEYRGGCAKTGENDNGILNEYLPVECGISRVMVRSTTTPGDIRLNVSCRGLKSESISWKSEAMPAEAAQGLNTFFAAESLPGILDRGETPLTPSYTDKYATVDIIGAETETNQDNVANAYDDNELTSWSNDGKLATASITYELREAAPIEKISLKISGWKRRCYPLEVYADGKRVFSGWTPISLGYCYLDIPQPIKAKKYTVKQIGAGVDKDDFDQIVEIAGGPTGAFDNVQKSGKGRAELKIIEIDFLRKL